MQIIAKKIFLLKTLSTMEREFLHTKFKSTHVYLNVSDYKVDMDDQITRVKIFTANDKKTFSFDK